MWVPQVEAGRREGTPADACVSLGYSAGAQILGNEFSPFPGGAIFEDRSRRQRNVHTSLMCSNPTGTSCSIVRSPVQESVGTEVLTIQANTAPCHHVGTILQRAGMNTAAYVHCSMHAQ